MHKTLFLHLSLLCASTTIYSMDSNITGINSVDSLSDDPLCYCFAHAAQATKNTFLSSKKSPDIYCIPKILQKVSSFRLVEKRWGDLLTVERILAITDISPVELARWQCRYAADQMIVFDKLQQEACTDTIKSTKSEEIREQFRIFEKEQFDHKFRSMFGLLCRSIIDPNMHIPIDATHYQEAEHEAIGHCMLSSLNPEKTINIPLLHYATRLNAHYGFISLLLFAGANPNTDIEDSAIRTPLYIATVYDVNPTLGFIFYLAGANPNCVMQRDGSTLLHSIVCNKSLSPEKILDSFRKFKHVYDADITIKNKDGNSIQQLNFGEGPTFGMFLFRVMMSVARKVGRSAHEKEQKKYLEEKQQYLASL